MSKSQISEKDKSILETATKALACIRDNRPGTAGKLIRSLVAQINKPASRRKMATKLIFDAKDLVYPNGLEIAVKGYKGDNGVEPTQVYVEHYEGSLRVHVWDGSGEDPTHSIEIHEQEPDVLAASSVLKNPRARRDALKNTAALNN